MAEVISGAPGATVIPCPLPDCGWVHVSAPGPAENPGALAGVFGWGVFSATALQDRLLKTEEALRDHFGSHDLAEWVAEVARLNDEIERLRAEMREDHG